MCVQLEQSPCSAAKLPVWAVAAEVSLPLVPPLLQLDAALQQLPADSPERPAAGRPAVERVSVLWSRWPSVRQLAASSSAAAEPALAEVQCQLVQAHLAGCRQAHWLCRQAAAGGSAKPFDSWLSPAAWRWLLLACLCKVFRPAVMPADAVVPAQA